MESAVEELISWINEHENSGPKLVLDHLCSYLRESIETYDWVGVYVVHAQNLKLYSFAGEETEHTEIKIGDGLCSLAVLKNSTVNEPDVKSNTEYLACFPSTESELVVPVMHQGKSIGEIDIDSDTKSAFGVNDEKLMARLAERISGIVAEAVS